MTSLEERSDGTKVTILPSLASNLASKDVADTLETYIFWMMLLYWVPSACSNRLLNFVSSVWILILSHSVQGMREVRSIPKCFAGENRFSLPRVIIVTWSCDGMAGLCVVRCLLAKHERLNSASWIEVTDDECKSSGVARDRCWVHIGIYVGGDPKDDEFMWVY